MDRVSFLLVALFLAVTASEPASAEPGPRHEAGSRKSGKYHGEGFFAGGSREVTSVRLKDVRRAESDQGYERVVFDLEPLSVMGVPYFQVQAANGEGRVVVSIWSDVQYAFDPARIAKAFARSRRVRAFRAIPRLEDGLSVFEIDLGGAGKAVRLDAFFLPNPSRIIVDLL